MTDATKICPACDAEYLSQASTCADCDVPLVRKRDVQDAKAPLPFSDHLVEVQTETLSWIKKLADRLAKAGIRSHIRPDRTDHHTALGRTDHYHTLYVRPEDAEAARQIDRDLLGHSEEAADEPASGASGASSDARCPACGSAFIDASDHCADCGLYLGG